ncbi:helix-turn-helix domain-containing protein [Sporolactobacillus sp. CPB3-1]|uniref:Helix-turn-helix domain-containing protein n=2 Tax=Sporolactobacillus mangiferae TaxID=2940498 RepID=A0ABT0M7G0_9BACL|nr:helix-turn-helix domain-containing protein [Sporolactobacillus mangiferae]
MTRISRTTLTTLAYNRSKGIQFDTMDAICTALKVEPSDILGKRSLNTTLKLLDHVF